MRRHEPTGDREGKSDPSLPSPFGGPGGLFGERPPAEDVQDLTDLDMDKLAEVWYNRSLAHFEAVSAVGRRPRAKRRFHDYTAKNCEEAFGNSVHP